MHKGIRRSMFFPWADLNQMTSTKAGAIQFTGAIHYKEARRAV